jgi:hypothetical protein
LIDNQHALTLRTPTTAEETSQAFSVKGLSEIAFSDGGSGRRFEGGTAMSAARRPHEALLLALLLALVLSSCSEHQELRQNNDPGRYTRVEDVLWASPAGRGKIRIRSS